jgi:hypothetical protein
MKEKLGRITLEDVASMDRAQSISIIEVLLASNRILIKEQSLVKQLTSFSTDNELKIKQLDKLVQTYCDTLDIGTLKRTLKYY